MALLGKEDPLDAAPKDLKMPGSDAGAGAGALDSERDTLLKG